MRLYSFPVIPKRGYSSPLPINQEIIPLPNGMAGFTVRLGFEDKTLEIRFIVDKPSSRRDGMQSFNKDEFEIAMKMSDLNRSGKNPFVPLIQNIYYFDYGLSSIEKIDLMFKVSRGTEATKKLLLDIKSNYIAESYRYAKAANSILQDVKRSLEIGIAEGLITERERAKVYREDLLKNGVKIIDEMELKMDYNELILRKKIQTKDKRYDKLDIFKGFPFFKTQAIMLWKRERSFQVNL